MTETFGHSNNFASLSLALTASPPLLLILYAPVRVNIRLSMLSAMGSLIVFLSMSNQFFNMMKKKAFTLLLLMAFMAAKVLIFYETRR